MLIKTRNYAILKFLTYILYLRVHSNHTLYTFNHKMKNKNITAVLAFVLGSVGAHKFYLGNFKMGILYFLFSWTSIPWLISMFEGVQYLTMAEQEFNYKHNSEYMLRQQDEYKRITQGQRGYPPTGGRRSSSVVPVKKKNPHKKKAAQKYKEYDFDGAIVEYKKALKIEPTDKDVHFRLACIYSLFERSEEAYDHLSKAVRYGFNDEAAIAANDNLVYLRNTVEYKDFVKNGYKKPRPRSTSEIHKEQKASLEISSQIMSKLEKLAEMKDKGIITEQEFQQQKLKLLNQL